MLIGRERWDRASTITFAAPGSPSVGTINLSVVAINPSVGIPSLQWNYQPFSGEYV
jgi:hypothetical protein